MAFVPPKDRVLEHSTSNSQTVFVVTGAIDTSFNAFSASMSIGDITVGGVVEPGTAFVSGILTYSAANQVTVTTVKESKGTFSSSGVKEVFMGLPAAAALMVDGAQALTSAQQDQARSNINANRTISTVTNTLASAVTMNSGANFPGPSCAQGTVGTWLAIGSVQMQDNNGPAGLSAFLSDGTTNLTPMSATTSGAGATGELALIGVFTNPAGNIRVTCNDGNGSPNGRINAGSTLTVVRIG